MTSRKWTTEEGYNVLTGWDPSLHRYFLVIDRPCVGCAGDGCETCGGTGDDYVFSNLSSPKYPTGGMYLRDVNDELERLVTEVPPDLSEVLTADCLSHVRPDTIDYGTLGRLRT